MQKNEKNQFLIQKIQLHTKFQPKITFYKHLTPNRCSNYQFNQLPQITTTQNFHKTLQLLTPDHSLLNSLYSYKTQTIQNRKKRKKMQNFNEKKRQTAIECTENSLLK